MIDRGWSAERCHSIRQGGIKEAIERIMPIRVKLRGISYGLKGNGIETGGFYVLVIVNFHRMVNHFCPRPDCKFFA